jgi:hypothetical protein
MLDLLHRPDSAVLRSRGTWHGGSGVLAGRIDGEMGVEEIGWAGNEEIGEFTQSGSLGTTTEWMGGNGKKRLPADWIRCIVNKY